jgi:hypothetical protein
MTKLLLDNFLTFVKYQIDSMEWHERTDKHGPLDISEVGSSA